MTARAHGRAGMTIVELLVGIVVAGMIMAALLTLFINQTRLFGEWESERTAREAVRAASQILIADLKRAETSGGIEAASASAVTIRIPFAMGLVCSSAAGSTVVSLLPADSATYAGAVAGGYAIRASAGYTYHTSLTSVTAGATSACTGASITTVTRGQVIALAPGAGTTVASGTPVFVYQRVLYEFEAISGRTVLTRTVLGGSNTEEVVVQTFVPDGTKFRFFVGTSTTADNTAPADLSTIRGFELFLEGKGDYSRPGSVVTTSDLAQKVFLMNPPN